MLNRNWQWGLILVCLPLLAACGPTNKFQTVSSELDQACNGQAIPNHFIVHFTDGHWEFPKASSRSEFVDSYVKPNLEKIDFVEPDQHISAYQVMDPPPSGTQIDNWGAAAVNAPVAWQNGARGSGVVVAVVDSGTDTTHPQLINQIDYNSGEMGTDAQGRDKRSNGVDDDGNGYVDDWQGYNFITNSGDMYDDVGHGTHVSGIIAAQHDDTTIQTGHVQGVAPQAKILPVKFLDNNGGSLSAALQGIDYAVMRGAKVINASWGGPGCAQALQQKIADLSNENVMFVAAAGNDGVDLDQDPQFPAAFQSPLQLTIGAIVNTLYQDSYSNYSKTLVNLFAPGSDIVSTVPTAISSTGYASMTGTSMATPFVSGAAADILSAHAGVTIQTVRQMILQSVDQDPTYTNATDGRLDIGKAVVAVNAL